MARAVLAAKERRPAECVVEVSGEPIAGLYPYLTEARVEASRDEAATATLVFDTRRDERGRWSVQDQEILVPWAPVVIAASFGGRREEIMRGFVREVAASYPESAGGATVTVTCQDESIALDREHVRLVWGVDVATSDRAIVEAIAGKHGLRAEPGGTGRERVVLHQDATDVRFLRERADANGYELLFRAGSIYFGPMRLDGEPQPTILVYAGERSNCRSMSVTTDGHWPDRIALDIASENGAGVVRREVSPDLALLGRRSASAAGRGLRDFVWLLGREGATDEDALLARARKKANDASLRVRAEGEIDGSLYGHVLAIGAPVAVDGIGEWLGGRYYVDRVVHRFSNEGYRQTITLLRNAYGDDLDAPGLGPLDLIR